MRRRRRRGRIPVSLLGIDGERVYRGYPTLPDLVEATRPLRASSERKHRVTARTIPQGERLAIQLLLVPGNKGLDRSLLHIL